MTQAVSYEFGVTTEPPVDRRPGGKGRPRTNPFDDIVWQSFTERWYEPLDNAPTGKWVVFPDKVATKEEKDKLEAQIRSSAHYWSEKTGERVGSSVRWNPETGVLQFRGAPGVKKSEIDSASDENAASDTASTQDADSREDWDQTPE